MIKLKRIKLKTLEGAALNEQEMKQIVGGNSIPTIFPTSYYTTPQFTHPADNTKVTTPINIPPYTVRPH